MLEKVGLINCYQSQSTPDISMEDPPLPLSFEIFVPPTSVSEKTVQPNPMVTSYKLWMSICLRNVYPLESSNSSGSGILLIKIKIRNLELVTFRYLKLELVTFRYLKNLKF